MSALYFAYGSNLKASRMRARAPSARAAGVARVRGYRLVLDKRGADGSAKANLAPAPGATVWGVLYALDPEEIPLLDRAEGGYARVPVRAASEAAEAQPAFTYVSERRLEERPEDRRAFPWYRALVLAGAREHGLPADWCEELAALPVRPEAEASERMEREPGRSSGRLS